MSVSNTVPSSDVQARLEAELARARHDLALSEARFRNVIERNADAVMVIDAEGVVRFANPTAEQLFANRSHGLVGSTFGFPLIAGETTEVDVVRNGDPPLTVEMRVVESDWEGSPALLATLRDVTERKQAQQAALKLLRETAAREAAEEAVRRLHFLAESSTVLSTSLDHASTLATLARLCVGEIADWVVIYIVEDDGEVRRLEVAHRDPARAEAVRQLRDFPIDRRGAHPVLKVLQSREPLVLRNVDDTALAAITSDHRHLRLVRELGMSAFLMVPLIARDRAVGVIALVSADPDRCFDEQTVQLAEDLALRAGLALDNARLFKQAEDANRSKSDFLAMISHDLRTPLGAIVGFADLLLMGVPERLGAGSTLQVERIRSAAGHLLHLIEELLAVARLDAGHEELRPSQVDVQALAAEVVALVEPLVGGKPVQLSLQCAAAPVVAHTDAPKLRQILTNLAANAVKYTERGSIRLDVIRAEDGAVLVRVADTGVGIAEEHLERVFEPFWQVDDGARSDGSGTGLGLSVVRRLADLVGAEITVASERGVGTTFTVRLPATPPQAGAHRPAFPNAPTQGPVPSV